MLKQKSALVKRASFILIVQLYVVKSEVGCPKSDVR